MSEIASSNQLRASFFRWAVVVVPAVVLLGYASGWVSGSGYENRWFAALDKPALPPGWVFGLVWTTLYILMGFSLAIILNARRAIGKGLALSLFGLQFGMMLIWSPLFFAAHQVTLALVLIVLLLLTVVATIFSFSRIRKAAAWLLVPYVAWLCLATIFNWQIHQKNPDAETLVPKRPGTQIML